MARDGGVEKGVKWVSEESDDKKEKDKGAKPLGEKTGEAVGTGLRKTWDSQRV